MQTALLLIAFGFGFKIFADSETYPKKRTKMAGRFVGILMMVVSLIGTCMTLGSLIQAGVLGCGHWGCPVHAENSQEGLNHYYRQGKALKGECPFIGKTDSPSRPSASESKQKQA